MVASATLPVRTRGISSAAAAAGQTAATKLGAGMQERRVKSAAVCGSSKTHAGAGRASLSSLVVTQQPPPPQSEDHPLAGRKLRGSLAGQPSPMEWNRDWGGEGTEVSTTPATAPPGGTTTLEVERGLLGPQAVQGGGKVGGEKPSEPEEKQTAANVRPSETEAAPATERKQLRPCPLAGILDMSEPPLQRHRRSCYNEDDYKVYRLPQTDKSLTTTGIQEPPREDERFKCVVDCKGEVRHAVDCALREVAAHSPRQSTRNSLASDRDPGHEMHAALTVAIPVRTWHKDNSSEWDPAGAGTTGEGITIQIDCL